MEHTIPIEVFRDMAELQDIIIEAAKSIYKEENELQRGPKHLRRGVSLHLQGVGGGSATAPMQLNIAPEVVRQENVREALNVAKQAIFDLFNAASAGEIEAIPKSLSLPLIARFAKVGRNLRDDEFVELNPQGLDGKKSRLDRNTRAFLVGLSDESATLEVQVDVQGTVVALDAKDTSSRTFGLKLDDGRTIVCKLPINDEGNDYYLLGVDLMGRIQDEVRVSVSGIGKVNSSGAVQTVDEVDDFEELNDSPILARLEELRTMLPDCFHSESGLTSPEVATFLAEAEYSFSKVGLSPILFVTNEGERLVLEWTVGTADVTLEVEPKSLIGEYHSWNESDDSEDEATFDLKKKSDLQQAVKKIEALVLAERGI